MISGGGAALPSFGPGPINYSEFIAYCKDSRETYSKNYYLLRFKFYKFCVNPL